MRPSTYILSPFLQYFSTTSARPEPLLFHTTHRCHSVFSCFSPLGEFHDRLVASEKVATLLPPVVDRTSGSLPRFPISMTLFRLRLTVPPGESSVPAQNSIGRAQGPGKPTISTVSKTALRSLAVALGDLESSPQHQRILDRPAVIVRPSSDLDESTRLVERPRSAVRFADLQERAANTSRAHLDQCRVQHLPREALSTEFRIYCDIQQLAVLSNGERDDISGDSLVRWKKRYEKDSGWDPKETTK